MIICMLVFAISCINAQQEELSKISGPYLGQKPSESSSLLEQTATREPLVLNFVANMGVLVSSGDSKILIDGLFNKPNPVYRAPAPGTVESIMKGEAPFDGVDLVLVTHRHLDHFDAALAVRYMEVRSEPILVAPSDAVEEMRKAVSNWSKIASRIISIDIKVGENVKKDVAHIPLTIVRTLHTMDKAPMNLMYLIEVNGWRVFHEGDWLGKPDDFLGFGLGTDPIDLAVFGYAWPLSPNPSYRRFLQEVLKPDHIALGHLTIKEENVAEGKIDKVRQYYKDIFVLLPGMPARVFRK
jgi:L-ascorbate metabolism protein UlaG (beta-lactamase superfamily)